MLNVVNSIGFVKLKFAFNRKIVWYYRKNTEGLTSYSDFLELIKLELIQNLRECSLENSIKLNLKLEVIYNLPNVENSSQNRAFKTLAKELFLISDIEGMVVDDLTKLTGEGEQYAGKCSGYTLQQIDGLLLGVYMYTSMGGSSYIELPTIIRVENAVTNPQNIDGKCFKWVILGQTCNGGC
jgi:hypothetical protein